jgi:hypothetical protein
MALGASTALSAARESYAPRDDLAHGTLGMEVHVRVDCGIRFVGELFFLGRGVGDEPRAVRRDVLADARVP